MPADPNFVTESQLKLAAVILTSLNIFINIIFFIASYLKSKSLFSIKEYPYLNIKVTKNKIGFYILKIFNSTKTDAVFVKIRIILFGLEGRNEIIEEIDIIHDLKTEILHFEEIFAKFFKKLNNNLVSISETDGYGQYDIYLKNNYSETYRLKLKITWNPPLNHKKEMKIYKKYKVRFKITKSQTSSPFPFVYQNIEIIE